MKVAGCCAASLVSVALVLAAAAPAAAQIENQVSVYTGDNAKGYLQPLVDAIGADLNSAVWTSAHIPEDGLHVSLETRVVGLIFGSDQKTFMATPEAGFTPVQPEEVPTVVGDGHAVIITGDQGSHFAFPGGFSLHSFALAVPQVRVGAYRGTEAVFRYFALNTGDVEVGDISLYGFGVRHSISQYFGPVPPVDLALGAFYQKFKLGDDLMDATAFTMGAQVSRRFPAGFASVEPYAALSMDTFSMDVSYQTSGAEATPEKVNLSFDTSTSVDFTVGLNLMAAFVSLNGEYSISGQSTFAFGIGFGF
jgi:hypothetical protein